jgi:hypothetical protein
MPAPVNAATAWVYENVALIVLALQTLMVVASMIVVLINRLRKPSAISERWFVTIFLKSQPKVSHFLLRTPLASWFLAILLIVIEIIDDVFSKASPVISELGLEFSPTVAAFVSISLAVFHQLAAWQMSSMQLRRYVELEEIWQQDGITHKAYIHEALASVIHVAKEIAHRIDQGEIRDTEISALKLREDDIRVLLKEQSSVSKHFFALDKRPGDQEHILEELFLQILKTTVVPLMEKTSGLVGSKEKPVLFPDRYATIVWEESLKIGLNTDGTHAFLPSATSLLPPIQFREMYESAPRPVSKARRLFLLSEKDGNGWEKQLISELNAIENRNYDGLPRPTTTSGKKAFGDLGMCHIAWIVEYHRSIGWELKFMEMAKFSEHWPTSPPELKHQDFLVAPCSLSSAPIIFTVDMDRKEDGIKHIGLPIDMRSVQVFWDEGDKVRGFFELIWDKAKSPQDLISNIKLCSTPMPCTTLGSCSALQKYLMDSTPLSGDQT